MTDHVIDLGVKKIKGRRVTRIVVAVNQLSRFGEEMFSSGVNKEKYGRVG